MKLANKFVSIQKEKKKKFLKKKAHLDVSSFFDGGNDLDLTGRSALCPLPTSPCPPASSPSPSHRDHSIPPYFKTHIFSQIKNP